MSGRERRGPLATLRSGWRWLLVPALAGMALGFAWGIADQARFQSTATVLVEEPLGGEPDAAALERFAALGGSEEVATAAAGVLGGDVAGADLLSQVEVEPAGGGATLAITATSDLPDFAAATADAFAAALTEVAADRANAAYRRASERLDGKLAELDPDSPEAAAVGERIADLETARASDPLTPGAAAVLPDSPSENRPAALLAGLGALLGLLVGAALIAFRARLAGREGAAEPLPALDAHEEEPGPGPELETEPEPEAEAEAEPEPEPEPEPLLAESLGVAILARLTEPGEAVRTDSSGLAVVRSPAGEAFVAIADAVGLDDLDAPRTLAVVDLAAEDGAGAVAAGIGVAAADLGKRVLVVDAGAGRPGLDEMLAVDAAPGLGDYLAGAASPREVLRTLRAAIEGGDPRPLVCVPAGGEGGEGLTGERFEALVGRLPRVYDLVLFAGPPLLDGTGIGEEAAALIGLVDEAILVVDGTARPPADLEEIRLELDRLRVAGIVATGTPEGASGVRSGR